MTRQIKRRQSQMTIPHRQIARRSKPDWKYTFNYDDEKFLKYFRSRTGIQVGKEDKPNLARFLTISPKSDHWLRTSKNFKYLNGKMVPFEYREDYISMNKVFRNCLQKWWDIYKKENQPRKIRSL